VSLDATDAPLACDIFVGAIVIHMARVFFTGAFRKPRELNWIVGSTLLILAIVNGFLGYSLPDDLVSGPASASRTRSSCRSVGRQLLGVLGIRGQLPGHDDHSALLILHCLIVPLIIIGLVSAHLFLLVRQSTRSSRQGTHRAERRRLADVPVFMAKTTGFLFIVGGITALLGAFAQVIRSGSSDRMTRRESPTPCNRTGTWVSSTARCDMAVVVVP